MDNERHAMETAPKGYALAFNGEPIKKSCETCNYMGDEGDGYISCPVCNWNDGNSNIDRLPTWPFRNGCKHFELHWTYSVDWDEEARKIDREREICEYLSHGRCFKESYTLKATDCDSAKQADGEYPICGKVPITPVE